MSDFGLPGVDQAGFDAWRATRAQGQPVDELFLAWACAQGAPSALEKLDRDYLARLGPTIGRVDRRPVFHDEVVQRVRERLLVRLPGAEPRLGTWEGTAPLASFLRAVALRTALNLKREEGAAPPDDDEVLETLSTSGAEPELALLRAQHHAAFKEAFRGALGELSVRERNVLRLQAIDGLTLERIGALYRVNKSTVSRWLSSSHVALAKGVKARLATSLSLDTAQLESFVRGLQSSLELSLHSGAHEPVP